MMIENMHDIPYIKSPNIGPEIVASMASLATALNKNYSEIPLGVQILTAGSKEAIAVAKVAGILYLKFHFFYTFKLCYILMYLKKIFAKLLTKCFFFLLLFS